MKIAYQGLQVLQPIYNAFAAQGLQLFLVGGPVRDLLMGRIPKDLDLATDALPEQTQAIMESIGAYVVDKLGGSYGTVHTVYNKQPIEITTFRANEDYTPSSRRPTVKFSTSIHEDLKRRDFRCNAIAANLSTLTEDTVEVLVDDPTCSAGIEDIRARVLKTPISAETSFTDDALRMLRAYRFRAQLGFDFDTDFNSAIQKLVPALNSDKCSWERIWAELKCMFEKGPTRVATVLREMMEVGLIGYILPELVNQVGFDQDNHYHHLLLWDHTLAVVDNSAKLGGLPTTVLACLLHDVAKAVCWQSCYLCLTCSAKTRIPDGDTSLNPACPKCGNLCKYLNRSFKGHDLAGAKLSEIICRRLKMSNADIQDIYVMIEEHQNWSRREFDIKSARKFVNKFGNLYPQMLILLRADRMGHAPGFDDTKPYDELERLISELDTQKIITIKPPIDGNAVMATLGMKPGPELGKIMKALQEATVLGEVTTKDEAYVFVIKHKLAPDPDFNRKPGIAYG